MNLMLRLGKFEDAEACGRICFDAFTAIANQHNFPPDFPSPDVTIDWLSSVFPRSDVFSVVAEVDRNIVGSNFLWENGSIAGVGPITVAPEVQNGAIGKHLMECVLKRATQQGLAGVRLVQAAYHNRSLALYTKLGFDAREPLTMVQGAALNLTIPGYTVRPAEDADVEECDRLCTRIHGHDRHLELVSAMQTGTASVVEQGDRIVGYTTMIGFFGYTVAESNTAMKAMIGAASSFPGPGFLLPTRNSDLFRWCLQQGLRVVQPLTLMSTGLYNEPKAPFLPSILY
jgi:GNAT superfamily N-acetyltransferase